MQLLDSLSASHLWRSAAWRISMANQARLDLFWVSRILPMRMTSLPHSVSGVFIIGPVFTYIRLWAVDTEFPSAEAMQDCIDHFLKGVATPLMTGYGVAHAAVKAGPTRMYSLWAFEDEKQWFAYDAAQKAAGGDVIMKYFVEGSTSNFAGAFGPTSPAYEESIAGWNSIPHFDCAIRKVVQGNFADGPTGFYVSTSASITSAGSFCPPVFFCLYPCVSLYLRVSRFCLLMALYFFVFPTHPPTYAYVRTCVHPHLCDCVQT